MLPSSGPEAGGGNATAGAGSLEGGAGEGGLGGVVVSLLVTLAVILGVLVVANLYTIAQVLNLVAKVGLVLDIFSNLFFRRFRRVRNFRNDFLKDYIWVFSSEVLLHEL